MKQFLTLLEAHHKSDSGNSVMTESEREDEGDILRESDGIGLDFDSVKADPTRVFVQADSINK